MFGVPRACCQTADCNMSQLASQDKKARSHALEDAKAALCVFCRFCGIRLHSPSSESTNRLPDGRNNSVLPQRSTCLEAAGDGRNFGSDSERRAEDTRCHCRGDVWYTAGINCVEGYPRLCCLLCLGGSGDDRCVMGDVVPSSPHKLLPRARFAKPPYTQAITRHGFSVNSVENACIRLE